MAKDDITPFMRFLNLLWIHRKRLILANLVVAVIALIVSLLLPKWYEGRMVFVVNEESGLAGGLAGSLLESALPIGIFDGAGGVLIDQYIHYLSSHTVIDRIDSVYHLQEEYEIEYRKKFYEEILGNAQFIDNDDNTITIKFYYEEDPHKAAAIANSFFVELEKLVSRLKKDKHRQMRIFLETSYEETLDSLTKAENKLRRFQEEKQIYDVDIQISSLIENWARLEAQKFQLEIEKKFLASVGTKTTAEYRSLVEKIAAIEAMIDALKEGGEGIDVPIFELPERGLEYVRLLREVKIREKILEFIIPQLEQVRLEEQRAVSNLQVLDPAHPQDYKAKPKRITIIFVTCFFFAISSILFVLVKEAISQRRQILGRVFDDRKI